MSQTIYCMRVSLRQVAPEVWRQVEVVASTKLDELHRVLQIVMGWTDSHLHLFRIGKGIYGTLDSEIRNVVNEQNVPLGKVAVEDDSFVYEYDFGDGWEHEILVEKVLAADPAAHYPRCTAGMRACPPEDCGGPSGYQDLLDAMRNFADRDYEEVREWIPDGFDPDQFSIENINKQLWRLR